MTLPVAYIYIYILIIVFATNLTIDIHEPYLFLIK